MCPRVVLLLHKRDMHTCKDLSIYYHSGKDVFPVAAQVQPPSEPEGKKLNQHPAINFVITAVARAHRDPLFHLFLVQPLGFPSRAVVKRESFDRLVFLESFFRL